MRVKEDKSRDSILTKPGCLILGHDKAGVIVWVHVEGEGDCPVRDGRPPGEAWQEHQPRRQQLN